MSGSSTQRRLSTVGLRTVSRHVGRAAALAAACRLESLEARTLLAASPYPGPNPNAEAAQFVVNQGQWADPSIRFGLSEAGANFAVTDSGINIRLFQEQPQASADPGAHALPGASTVQSADFSVAFDGARLVRPVGVNPSATQFNYYVGDASTWRGGVGGFGGVLYSGLYDGIDLQAIGQSDHLKYEFHVAPGADWRQIQVHYSGTQGLSLGADGSLRAQTALGDVTDAAPYIYQVIDGREVAVAGSYQLLGSDSYGFSLSGTYDPGRELVIDPNLAWTTYLGGSGWDGGYGIAVDSAGNALVTGYTLSPDFAGANNNGLHGSSSLSDAFVAKVSSTGSLLSATYLGGSSWDGGYGIALDSVGNALVTGNTSSADFAGANNTYRGGNSDAYVAKVSAAGALLWATYLGGSDSDAGKGIALDGAGNALVTGCTQSTDFAGANNSYHGSGQDGFVAKVSAAGALTWATYVGGSNWDGASGIALDGAGNALVAGSTASTDLAGANNSYHGGGYDAFVAKVSAAGALTSATYVGGSDWDGGYGIAVDSAGNALVTGDAFTKFGGANNSNHGSQDVFVAKVSAAGALTWATYLGGSSIDSSGENGGPVIAVDSAGNALVTGYTESTDFAGTNNSNYGSSQDAFVAKVSTAGALVWATYVGGSGWDSGYGIAVDGAGNALVTGSTSSTDFAGATNSLQAGDNDAFVARIPADGPTPLTPYLGSVAAAVPGTIEAENFDSGGEGVAYHDLTVANSGGFYGRAERVDIEKCSDTGGGYDVGWNQPGEWLEYTVNVTSTNTYRLDIRAAYGAANASGGTVHLESDGINVTGAITLPKTGGWQTWQTVSKSGLNLTAGRHVLRLVFDKDGAGSTADTAYLANINWIKLTPPGASQPYPGPTPAPVPGKLELENFDKGGEGVAYHDLTAANSGGQYRSTDRVDIEKSFDTGGGYDVGWNQPGEWLRYTVNATTTGAYNLDIRAAYGGTNATGGTVHMECDGVNVSGPIALPKTGGWQTWQTVTKTGVNLAAGQHVLTLVMDKDGAGSTANTAYLANINWVSLTAPPTQGPTGHLDDPKNGASIDAVALNARGWIDITYSGPNPLDASSITDQDPEFTLSGPGAANVQEMFPAVATLVGGSTYRYSFTLAGTFVPGVVNVNFIAGSAADIFGYTNLADTKSFTVAGPYPGPDPAQVPGTIQAENFNTGGEGVAYHDTTTANEGGQYRSERVDVEKSGDTGGGYDVGWVRAGEWLAYDVDIDRGGAYDFSARVASKGPGGKFHLAVDGQKVAGSDMTIPTTGGWQTWTTITASSITLPIGRHSLSLVFDTNGTNDTGGGPSVGNVNWFRLTDPQLPPGAPGSLDPSFGTGGIATSGFAGTPFAVAVQTDGKVVVASTTALVRFTADGKVDTAFGFGGQVITDFALVGLALTADGYIVVAGTTNDSIALAEYTPAGALYSGFGTGGQVIFHDNSYPGGRDEVKGVGIDGQGRILVADNEAPIDLSTGWEPVVVRFSSTGARIDHRIGGFKDDFLTAVSAPDGSVLFGGTHSGAYATVTRVDSNGVMTETSPGYGGGPEVAGSADGRIYFAGTGDSLRTAYVACLDSSLKAVPSFGDQGRINMPDRRTPLLAVQPDGKLLLGDGVALYRLNLDGTPDLTFGAGGSVRLAFGLGAVGPDGKIYLFATQNGMIAVARLLS